MVSRKTESERLFQALARAPWWIGVVLAVVAYVAVGVVLPSVADDVYRPVVDAVAGPAAWLFAGIFLLLGGVSAFQSCKKRRMLAANWTKEAIRELGWDEFEELVEAHYRSLGFSVRRTGGAGPDGGVDVRFTKASGETYLVQCKQWARPIGVKVVRELLGVVTAENATGGIVVTAGSFTPEAKEFVDGVAVQLIDGDQLQDMLDDLPTQRATSAEDDDSTVPNACPRCGSALVLRTARRGRNHGSRFYGCSSFPQCRFTQPC